MTVIRILFLWSVIIFLPDVALAGSWATSSNVGETLCDVADSMGGLFAGAVATIAICSIGVMACLGRVQWTTVIVVVTGIVILFGALDIAWTIGQSLGLLVTGTSRGGC